MRVWVAPHGMHVEPAKADDAERLAQLHAESFFRGWPAADFAAYAIDRSTPGFVVADRARKIHGFLMLRLAGEEAEILTVAIDRRQRRKGFGAALLQAAIDDLLQSPARALFLEVDESNVAARRLYRRFGFRETGTRKDYYQTQSGKPASALVMRLDLG